MRDVPTPPGGQCRHPGQFRIDLGARKYPFCRPHDGHEQWAVHADDRRGPDVRLRDIAELIQKTGPDSVDHYDLSRLIDVLVTPMGNDLGRVATDIEER